MTVAGLLLTGMVTAPWEAPAWKQMRAREPALNLRGLEGAWGQGLMLGLLGGFRSITADFLWLQTNQAWEEQDLPRTQTLIGMITTVDPRPVYFWVNGARMIAYDMPQWRIEAAGGARVVPASVQRRIDEQQASVALQLLQRGLGFHPDNPALLIEIAMIYERRLGDVAASAEYFHRAALAPGAPPYAARIYGELLKRMGRDREAYAWLCEEYPKLDAADPGAMADLVLERIRLLEKKLGVPPEQRYKAPPPEKSHPAEKGTP